MDKVSFSKFITESPLPDDWDGGMYNERTPFSRRVKYAQERAKKLGAGSSRIAFVIPYQGRDTVLKIAKNSKGMAQNEAEAQVLDDYYLKGLGIFIPMIDYDEENTSPTWIHTEMASKASAGDFVRACGGSLDDLIAFAHHYCGKKYTGRGDYTKVNPESELAQSLGDYLGNYDANFGDYSRLANWGIYDGSPVIIDAGFNDEVRDLYYSKPAAGRW